MSWHGGKGDKPRSVNKQVYDAHFENIFSKKGYNLFVDDTRSPSQAFLWEESGGNTLLEKTRTLPFQWEVVRSFDEFKRKLEEKGLPNMVSLDNDLTEAHCQYYLENQNSCPDKFSDNGIACAKLLLSMGMPVEKIFVHSNNIQAVKFIEELKLTKKQNESEKN